MYLNIINNIRHESKRKIKIQIIRSNKKKILENVLVKFPMIMLALFTIQSFMEI